MLLITKMLTKVQPSPIIASGMPAAAVENILKESRSAIVALLKTHGTLSAEQLARLLEVSSVCVRRHLSLLRSDGLVCYELEHGERGRPRYLYRLTAKADCLFQRTYDQFALEVLGQVQQTFGECGLQRILSGRGEALIERLKREFAGLSFEEQVKRLAKIVSERGYLAEARRLKDGSYRLRQRNCPTEKVAVAYPQVCQEELRIYREALGCEVMRECRIADGAPVCEYRIWPPRKRSLRVLQS